MALPYLLDAIDHIQLGMSTPSDEDESSEEQQDLLESLAVKGVLKSSKTKDVYQKFVNILDARPHIWDLAPTRKPRVNPPVPPGQVDPPPTPVKGNPTPNSGASSGSNWELGKIPTDEKEPKKLFSYRNPLYTKPAVPPPKVSNPIPPIPHQGSKAGEREPAVSDPSGSGVFLQFMPGIPLWITLKGILLQTKCPNRRLPPRRWQDPLKASYTPPSSLEET